MQGLWHWRGAWWGVGTLAMLGRGLIPLFWLMASDGTMEFSVSVCHFTVDALSVHAVSCHTHCTSSGLSVSTVLRAESHQAALG